MNNSQHSEFDEFKRAMCADRAYSILSTNALIDYWNEKERNGMQPTVMIHGRRHYKLHYTEMDQLCEWVYNQRGKMVMTLLYSYLFNFFVFFLAG